MAIAKTPKNTAAASSPAAPKSAPAARAAVAKPAAPKPPIAKPAAAKAPVAKAAPVKPARAAAAKAATPAEDAIVHSAEVAPKIAAEVTKATDTAAKATTDTVAKTADAVAKSVEGAAKTTGKVVDKAVAKASDTAAEAADTLPEVVAKPALALPVAVKAAKTVEDNMMRGVGPLLDFGRENAILMVAAGNELALGLHRMSLSVLDWSAESCDKSVAAGQKMLTAKSVEEVIDLTQTLAQDSLQQILKESSELNKLSRKLIEDTFVPLPGRMVAAVEKLAAHAG